MDRSNTPFEQWAAKEGIPVIRGYSVEDMYKVPLKPWPRKGGSGALIILEGTEGWSSAYVCQIPPGGSLKPQRHFFEEVIYVLEGEGETRVWNEGGPEQTFAWHEYSLFAIPLNAWHQHRCTGNKPAKYVAVTNAPLFFNVSRNPEFIFNNNFVFSDRFNGEKDVFDGVGKIVDSVWHGGLIPDVRKTKQFKTVYGSGFRHLHLKLSGNTCGAHLARIEVGTYKKAHRHSGGAHLIIVQGTGYANMWPEGGKMVTFPFKKGSLYSPPEAWFHQHMNTGTDTIEQIAFTLSTRGEVVAGKIFKASLDMKKGGDMLELEDEDPAIRKRFESELKKKRIKSAMPPVG